jgi:DNA modification methylase
MELMKEIPDKSIDVVITDPPYGILGGSKSIGGSKPIGGSKLYKVNEYNLGWDNERMSEEVFKEFQRISRHQGCLFYWGCSRWLEILFTYLINGKNYDVKY